MKQIYCDESGFTGNHLLNEKQPYFVYASVAIEEEKARELVEKTISSYNVQNGELKGANLVKFSKGRKAVESVIQQVVPDIQVSFYDKKYALAGKFFEYIFEPVLKEKSTFFYGLGFHEFIASTLYMLFKAKHENAETIFADFERLIHEKSLSGLNALLVPNDVGAKKQDVLSAINEFAFCCKSVVEAELDSLRDNGTVGKWVLDLTTSALFPMLIYWTDRLGPLTVVCDNSKPLAAAKQFLDSARFPEEDTYLFVGDTKHKLNYRLDKPITMGDSKTFFGIQIADVISSALCYSLVNPEEEFSKNIKKMLLPYINHAAIPDRKAVDLSSGNAVINGVILLELVERAKKGGAILDGFETFLESLEYSLGPRFMS